MQTLGQQLKEIKPYILKWIGESGNASGSFAPSPHDMQSAHHTGSISNTQGPQFLLTDGSRALSGNLAVAVGITIDGVDLSAHAANPAAHHTPFVGLTGDTGSAVPNGFSLIQIVGGNGIASVGSGSIVTLNMDTPSTLSVSSTNSASSGHSHTITSSPTPGVAASLLATNSSGQLSLDGRLVLGNVTEALRIAFDISNYTSMRTTSGGNFVLEPTGDVQFNPAGKDILPQANYDLNMGALQKKYLTLHAAELWVETLVAQDTLATVGGRVLVGPTTTLTSDLISPSLKPAHVSSTVAASTAVTGIGINTPTGTTGDVLVATICWKHATATITPPAGWTLIQTPTQNGTINIKQYYRVTDGTETSTYTWTLSVACPQSSVINRISNPDPLLPIGVFGSASVTTSTSLAAPTITPARASSLVLYVTSLSTTPTVTPPGSYTEQTEQGTGTGAEITESATLADVPAQPTGSIAATVGVAATGIACVVTIYPNIPSNVINTKHNSMAVGDTVFLEASGKIEFMSVASGPTGVGPYSYTMNRNLDGTGLNDWYAGDAVFNTGQTGNGFIDLYSTWGAGIAPFDHIYNLDETGGSIPYETGTYSVDHASDVTWTLLESGAAPHDAVYFGSDSTFTSFHLWLTTAGVGSFGFGIEYWNSSTGAWTAIASVATFPGSFLLSLGDVGASWVLATGTPGWGKHTVNGVSAFWVRLQIQSGSLSTKPVQGVRRVNRSRAQYGPTIVMDVRNSSTFNDWTERTAMGNLNGLYGYGSDTFGFAAGKSGGNWFAIEETNGLRMFQGTLPKINLQIDGDVFIGDDISVPGKTYFSIFSTAQTYNSESMAAGDMLIGDNSSSKANIKWIKSTGRLSFRGGTSEQAYIATDGTITAGAGAVTLNSNGLRILYATSYSAPRSIEWIESGTTLRSSIRSYSTGAASLLQLFIPDANGDIQLLTQASGDIQLDAGTTQNYVHVAGSTDSVEIRSNNGLYIVNKGIALGVVPASIPDGVLEMTEKTAPAAPGTNGGRLFLQDNGAGKTQLCIIFNTGAVQVIATQP